MRSLYEKIMQQPREVRKKIAFGITAGFGFILISLWLFMSSNKIQNSFLNSLKHSDNQTAPEKSPSIKDSFDDMMNSIEETANTEETDKKAEDTADNERINIPEGDAQELKTENMPEEKIRTELPTEITFD